LASPAAQQQGTGPYQKFIPQTKQTNPRGPENVTVAKDATIASS
jgi:hypothetical protein